MDEKEKELLPENEADENITDETEAAEEVVEEVVEEATEEATEEAAEEKTELEQELEEIRDMMKKDKE